MKNRILRGNFNYEMKGVRWEKGDVFIPQIFSKRG